MLARNDNIFARYNIINSEGRKENHILVPPKHILAKTTCETSNYWAKENDIHDNNMNDNELNNELKQVYYEIYNGLE